MENDALRGHKNIIRLMIEQGANSFTESMVYAAQNGHEDIVRLIRDQINQY